MVKAGISERSRGVESLSQRLTQGVLKLVRERGLEPGDRLPSVKELAERFSVATPTMREALRLLICEATAADVATARVHAVHDTGRGGIIVTLRQRVGDVEIHQSDVKLLLRRDQSLLAISGSALPAASYASALKKRGDGFRLGPEAALAHAFDLHPEAAVRFEIDNVSITLIEHFEQADPAHAWRVGFVNYMPRELVVAKSAALA